MYLCVDVGGTKTLVALVDAQGEILTSWKFATAQDQEVFWRELRGVLAADFAGLEAEGQGKGGSRGADLLRAVVVAMPGPVRDNRVLWLGNLPWQDFDLAGRLEAELGVPVRMENDANLAGLAEAAGLTGVSLYLTFSTGIGAGVLRDGRIEERWRDFEPGHGRFEWGGKVMEWEDFGSARAVAADFGKLSSEVHTGAEWQEVAERLGVGLRVAIEVLRPERVIFGGPLGLELEQYRGYLEANLRVGLAADMTLPHLMTARYGGESVIYGCYLYARAAE